jgi:hypothetical protein
MGDAMAGHLESEDNMKRITKKQTNKIDPEIAAIGAVHKALDGLAPDAQARVLNYVAGKLRVDVSTVQFDQSVDQARPGDTQEFRANEGAASTAEADDGLEGISPVARKWMTRNGLRAELLAKIFSLGGDEIDLIAKEIPGKSKRDRMHSVSLLMGIAAYLGSGAARFTHEQLKEACLHYKAYDSPNFASSLKSFSAEVSGDKSTAYVLTPRGMSSATDIVRQMLGSDTAR